MTDFCSTKLRKIPIEYLEIGMYLEDVLNKDGVLLFCGKMSVGSLEQIEQIKNRGVSSVYINPEKGKDIPLEKIEQLSAIDQADREYAYYKELSRATEVHKKTLETAREALSAVRMGKQFTSAGIEHAAEGIVESILRNPDAIVSLSQIKGYDEYTYVHSVNVSILITSLAHSIGFSQDLLVQAGMGGILHDIGKMRVPEPILNKQSKYTEEEFAIMKKHPEHGINILKDYKGISDFSKTIVIEHHERYNGQGYPKGLRGDSIKEIARIAAVADVYDAMTTDRIYRAAWLPQKALALIFQGCDKEYSRRIVELFTKHLGIFPVGSFVRLYSGEMGVVVRIEKGELLAPNVLVLFSTDGRRLKTPVEYRLNKKQKEENGKLFRIERSLNPNNYGVQAEEFIKGNPLDN